MRFVRINKLLSKIFTSIIPNVLNKAGFTNLATNYNRFRNITHFSCNKIYRINHKIFAKTKSGVYKIFHRSTPPNSPEIETTENVAENPTESAFTGATKHVVKNLLGAILNKSKDEPIVPLSKTKSLTNIDNTQEIVNDTETQVESDTLVINDKHVKENNSKIQS